MKTTQFSAKAHNQENSTEPTKFKDIDSRVYGLKKGGRAGYKGGGMSQRGLGRAFMKGGKV